MRLVGGALCVIWLALIAGAAAPDAITPSGSPARRSHAFDVVSIRPSKRGQVFAMVGALRDQDTYRAINTPLGVTILEAFFPMPIGSRDRVQGTPAWVWNENYDFVGKVSAADMPEWRIRTEHWDATRVNPLLQEMLQASLADRCKLVVHRVPAEIQGYVLVIGKSGPNYKVLKASSPGELIPSIAQDAFDGGKIIPYARGQIGRVGFLRTSMVGLAQQLSFWGAPVEDRTGLTGRYDFDLLKLSDEGDPSLDWDVRALGLKLRAVKVATEDIVVDRIERPSPN